MVKQLCLGRYPTDAENSRERDLGEVATSQYKWLSQKIANGSRKLLKEDGLRGTDFILIQLFELEKKGISNCVVQREGVNRAGRGSGRLIIWAYRRQGRQSKGVCLMVCVLRNRWNDMADGQERGGVQIARHSGDASLCLPVLREYQA